jgi:hypothetical protein
MTKNGKEQNVVPTSVHQNIAAAQVCETYQKACSLFRALEWANNRGTAMHQFDMLETHFIEKMGTHNYIKEGL